MIDPKELMLHNIVMCNDNEVVITELRSSKCEIALPPPSTFVMDVSYRFIQPIPLTPEILERCGFKQALNTPELYSAPDGLFNIINDYGSAWYNINKKVLEVGYYNNEIPCESLHHLQNLLTALGKKLEVK